MKKLIIATFALTLLTPLTWATDPAEENKKVATKTAQEQEPASETQGKAKKTAENISDKSTVATILTKD